jgi:hypothetical protein
MISDMETAPTDGTEKLTSPWGFTPSFVVCNQCGWSFLESGSASSRRCPHCFKMDLATIEAPGQIPDPELVLPFTVSKEGLAAEVARFSQSIPYPPADLSAASLSSRLQRIFFPAWLVDASVRATWQGEAGFNYEVVSHQERYSEGQGGWKTREIKEPRVRWEPRLGRMERTYQNISVPALEEDARLRARLGSYNLSGAQSYKPDKTGGSYVRLPDRSQDGAWPEALPRFQAAASEECRQAAAADHLRDFRWSPEFQGQNWTLLLLPLYATYYLDDDNQPQAIYIHGQSGKVSGQQRASARRAKRSSLMFLVAAGVVFLISLLLAAAGLIFPLLLVVGGIGLIAAVMLALGAIIPVATVRQFNRAQRSS